MDCFDPEADAIWHVGDLINRGPHSLETLRLWRDIGGRGVLGNHEVYALMVRAGRWPRKADTLDALRDAEDADALFEGLAALPVLTKVAPSATRRHERGPEVWAVHAGVDPRWTELSAVASRLAALPRDLDFFEHDDVSCATRIRCCTPEGERSPRLTDTAAARVAACCRLEVLLMASSSRCTSSSASSSASRSFRADPR